MTACAGASNVAEIYRKHRHRVLKRAKQLLHNDQEARDIVQEVFVMLLDKPHPFAARSDILSWLYSATTHLCLNRIRNQTRRQRIVEEKMALTAEAEAQPIAEIRIAANEALARAPKDLARVAVYYYFDDLTQAEIAEILGCTRRNVGYLLERFGQYAV
jgi:RNA polymerase sigma-70 factor (ECF subfamily)